MPSRYVRRALGALLLLSVVLGVHASDRRTEVPEIVSQGALVRGETAPGNRVQLGSRILRVDAAGRFVFGVGRDERGPLQLRVDWFDGARETINLKVQP